MNERIKLEQQTWPLGVFEMNAHSEDTGARSLSQRQSKALKWKMPLWRYYMQEYLWKWIEGMCFTLREAREHFSITARETWKDELREREIQEERHVWCVNSSESVMSVSGDLETHLQSNHINLSIYLICRVLWDLSNKSVILTHSSEVVTRSAVVRHTCKSQQTKTQIGWSECVNYEHTPCSDCDCVSDMK